MGVAWLLSIIVKNVWQKWPLAPVKCAQLAIKKIANVLGEFVSGIAVTPVERPARAFCTGLDFAVTVSTNC
jgi:hypothetical protein